jgi:CBS domain-containing protein
MKVSRLMHEDAITCRTVDTLDRAARLMWDHDIGCVPVTDDQGHIAGMITDRDICMAAYTRGVGLSAIPVNSAMATRVYSCGPDDELRDVERIMSERQIRRMPVIDGEGHPIAVISLNDIARASVGNGVPAREVAATLAAVCTPREAIGWPSS